MISRIVQHVRIVTAQQAHVRKRARSLLERGFDGTSVEEVAARDDPTAHAVVLALREAAKRLGTRSLSGLTVFTTVEPCAMCVGALLEADADCLVYALSDPVAGAAGSVVQLANNPALPRRLDLISGILRSDAAELAEVAVRREP